MKDFFERLNTLGKTKRNDIIEKDFHLHRLLSMITKDEYLTKNLVFKGGTCLIKAYTGYHRFSEDIDFTWKNDELWKNKTTGEVKRSCSNEISKVIRHIKAISDELGLKFSGDKNNADEVHISSGGRMVVFFLGYKSDILNIPSNIKVEINFVDITLYPIINKKLKSYINELKSDELKFLYENLWNDYQTNIVIDCYDPRELFIEKCRAALTRKGYKLRDVIDLYIMEKKFGYQVSKFKMKIKTKIEFMLDLYKRYRENIEFVQFPSKNVLDNEEMKLMLIPTPKDLQRKIAQIHTKLNETRSEFIKGI